MLLIIINPLLLLGVKLFSSWFMESQGKKALVNNYLITLLELINI